MRVFAVIGTIGDGRLYLLLTCPILLLLGFIMSFAIGAKYFLPLSVLCDSFCFYIAACFERLTGEQLGCYILFAAILTSGLSLIRFFISDISAHRCEKRRSLQAALVRDRSFTLPDRENSFIVDRLNRFAAEYTRNGHDEVKTETSENVCKSADERAEDLIGKGELRLDYVRKLLSELHSAAIQPAELLELERISKQITFYASENALTAKQTRALNDCFSAVIKMSAKYGI